MSKTILGLITCFFLFAANLQPLEKTTGLSGHHQSELHDILPKNAGNSTPAISLLSQIGGISMAIQKDGDLVYIGAGPRMMIIDVSNTASPQLISQTEIFSEEIRFIRLYGQYAYAGISGGDLKVIDISDPQNPTIANTVTLTNPFDVSLAGDKLYYAIYSGLEVYDISNPTLPTQISYVSASPRGVKAIGNEVFLLDGTTLRIFDFTDPQNPSQVGTYSELSSAPRYIDIEGNYAFITTQNSGISILDISNRTTPKHEADLPLGGGCEHLDISADYLYATCGMSTGMSGLYIADISVRSSPQEIGFQPAAGLAYKVVVEGFHAYISDEFRGLRVISVLDPSSPSEVGAYEILGTSNDIEKVGHYAYIPNGRGGLGIIDVKDPSKPNLVSVLDTPGYAYGIDFYGDIAYVADWNDGGIRILDISDPANPVEVGSYDIDGYTGGVAVDVTVAGDHLYVSDGGAGIRILDIVDPLALYEVGVFGESSGAASDVEVIGNTAYAAFGSFGLSIWDISDPTSPSKLGDFPAYEACDVEISDEIAFIANRNQGVLIVDISDPTSPSEISQIPVPGTAQGITSVGNTLYIADYWEGVRVVDITDLLDPQEIAYFTTAGSTISISLHGNKVYVVDDHGGLYILQGRNVEPIPHASQVSSLDSRVSYDSGWHVEEDINTTFGLQPYSTTNSSTSIFSFVGDRFELIYSTGPEYGQIKISIDGTLAETIDQYSTTPMYQEVWESEELVYDIHNVEIVSLESKKVSIDGFNIGMTPFIHYLPIIIHD